MKAKLKRSPDDVVLAGLGALAVAEQEGEEFFENLVKKGKELKVGRQGVAKKELRTLAVRAIADAELGESDDQSASDSRRQRSGSLLRSAGLPDVPDEEIARRQADRNAAAREDLVAEFGVLSSNLQMESWMGEGRTFSVNYKEHLMFPAFQFDAEGQPLPVIARVLDCLGQQSSGWELALWFTAGNGWLDDRRPVDLLESEPEEVAQAAEREAEELFF